MGGGYSVNGAVNGYKGGEVAEILMNTLARIGTGRYQTEPEK